MEWTDPARADLVNAYQVARAQHRTWRPAGRWGLLRGRWLPGVVMVTDPQTGTAYTVTRGQPTTETHD